MVDDEVAIDADLVVARARLEQRCIRERRKILLQHATRALDAFVVGPARAEVRILLPRIGRGLWRRRRRSGIIRTGSAWWCWWRDRTAHAKSVTVHGKRRPSCDTGHVPGRDVRIREAIVAERRAEVADMPDRDTCLVAHHIGEEFLHPWSAAEHIRIGRESRTVAECDAVHFPVLYRTRCHATDPELRACVASECDGRLHRIARAGNAGVGFVEHDAVAIELDLRPPLHRIVGRHDVELHALCLPQFLCPGRECLFLLTQDHVARGEEEARRESLRVLGVELSPLFDALACPGGPEFRRECSVAVRGADAARLVTAGGARVGWTELVDDCDAVTGFAQTQGGERSPRAGSDNDDVT